MTDELPRRWIEDAEAPAELRALCRAAVDAPAEYDVAAALSRHRARVGASAGAAVTTRGRSTPRIVGAVGLVVAGAAIWGATRPAEVGTPTRFTDAIADVELRSPAPVVDPPPPLRVEPVVAARPPVVVGARERVATRRDRPVAPRIRPAPTAVPPAPTVDDATDREVRLMIRMRSALRRDPAAALALVAEAEREFPRGWFVEERRAAEVIALDRLGRSADASARARAFLDSHPSSVHASKVARVLDGNPDTPH